MSIIHAIKIESPRMDHSVVSHYVLQQKMKRKVQNLQLDWAKFNTKEFKEIYMGAVIEMSMERLLRLKDLTDEEEIVHFLRKKSNKCKESSLSSPCPSSQHATQEEPA